LKSQDCERVRKNSEKKLWINSFEDMKKFLQEQVNFDDLDEILMILE